MMLFLFIAWSAIAAWSLYLMVITAKDWDRWHNNTDFVAALVYLLLFCVSIIVIGQLV